MSERRRAKERGRGVRGGGGKVGRKIIRKGRQCENDSKGKSKCMRDRQRVSESRGEKEEKK